ncbi:MAG: DUF4340 domain-containing protein [Oscillospiraceae bacterium]|nr:DUF4340 domain-containing protein [Oscillospiraceae bacterium]
MKKNIKLIIICAVVVVLLAGVAVFLKLTAPEEEEETAEEEVTSQLLYEKDPLTLGLLTITNEYGTYELVRFGEGDEAMWGVPEYADLPVDGKVISNLVEKASTMTSQRAVTENPEDISIYGLDAPSAEVTAEFSDSAGTIKKLTIGNLTPDERQRYFMIDDDPTVYTALNSAVSCFTNDKHDVIARTVYTARQKKDENDTADYTRINKLTVRRPDLDYDFVIEYDKRQDDPDAMTGNSSRYVVTSPVKRDMNPDKAYDVTDKIFGLTASDLAVLRPEEKDFESLQLTDSDCAAKILFDIYGGDTVDITVGKEAVDEEGKKAGRFVYVDGIDIIYIFSEENLPWLKAKPMDVVTTMITSNYIYEVEIFDIEAAGKKMHFTFEGNDNKTFKVWLDGKEMDADKFRTLYQFILRAPSDELYFEDTDTEPAVTVTIKTGSVQDVIEFIPDKNRKAMIRLNGKMSYKCASAYIDRLIKNLELYENGQDIITDW